MPRGIPNTGQRKGRSTTGRRSTAGSNPQWGKSHQNQLQKAYELIGGLMQHMGLSGQTTGRGRTTTGRGRTANRTTGAKRGQKIAATG